MPSVSDFLTHARAQIGDPYVWAAEGPDAFDQLVDYLKQKYSIPGVYPHHPNGR